MKKSLLIIIMVVGTIFSSQAQIEVVPSFGYFWGGKVNFYEGTFDAKDGANYGIAFDVPTMKGNWIELSYSYNHSSGDFIPYNSYIGSYDRITADLNTHYMLIGSHQQIKTGGNVEPFFGLALGAVVYDYKYQNVSNVWRFAGAVKGGFKVYINDQIGLNFQGRLLMPMYFAGVGFYAGSGGSGFSLNSGSVAIQGDVSLGLIFRLK